MFGLTGTLNYYLCDGFIDMRCGIDGLSKLVRTKMRQDPMNGNVYIFISKGSCTRKVIGNFLSGFKGAIKTDGYNAYKMFEGETDEKITRTDCMAHVRRKFLEALVSDKYFQPFIEKISRLYWVEAEARIDKLKAAQVKKLRKEKSVPILGNLFSQIESLYQDKQTRHSDLLQKTINYAYHVWKAVVRWSPVAYIKDVICSLIKGETNYLQLIPCNWVNNK